MVAPHTIHRASSDSQLGLDIDKATVPYQSQALGPQRRYFRDSAMVHACYRSRRLASVSSQRGNNMAPPLIRTTSATLCFHCGSEYIKTTAMLLDLPLFSLFQGTTQPYPNRKDMYCPYAMMSVQQLESRCVSGKMKLTSPKPDLRHCGKNSEATLMLWDIGSYGSR